MKARGKEWIERGGDLVVLSVGVAAALMLLSGCGQQKSESAQSVSPSSEPPAIAMVAVNRSSAPPTAMNAAVSQGSTANTDTEILPPEIALGELNTAVTPGQPIEITVYGTPDVTEMSMWDGLGDRQALVHDTAHDVWSVKYRVPLKSKQDRIGLSVTAKNEGNRWRRVWVFLQVSPANVAAVEKVVEHATEASAADSVVTR